MERLILLLPVLASSVAAVQEPAPNPVEESAVEPAPDGGFDALVADYRLARAAWEKLTVEMRKQADESGVEPQSWPASPESEFVARFEDAAKRLAGKPEAVPFLIWIARFGGAQADAFRDAIRILCSDHAADPRLAEIAHVVRYLPSYFEGEERLALMALLERDATSPVLRAVAAFAVREHLLRTSPVQGKKYQDALSAILGHVEAAAEASPEYKDMLDRDVVDKIRILEQHGVGTTAQDINGVDLDGVAFKLSDYKGKVILVDFWGDW